jgi:hypothetical protein
MVRGRYRRKRRIVRVKRRIKCLICFFILVTLYRILFDSYSLFESEANSTADVDIAFFCIDDTYDAETINIGEIGPDDKEPKEYKITVSNFRMIDGEKYRADTNIEYDLELRTTTNLPLKYELYVDDSKENNIRNNIKQDEYNTYFKCIYEEVAHKLDRTKDQTRTYTLKISYPEGEEYKKSEYQNIIDCVEVKIDARQIYR